MDKEKTKEVKPVQDSEIGNWTKVSSGWLVHFYAGGVQYSLSLSPLDADEHHWKFVYFKYGQRNSSDINKFGSVAKWSEIWGVIIEILKDFIRIFRPLSVKFIGMSLSKRGIYYREIFKIYSKQHLNVFRPLGYHSNFDYKNIEYAPSFVIKKGGVNIKKVEKNEIRSKETKKTA